MTQRTPRTTGGETSGEGKDATAIGNCHQINPTKALIIGAVIKIFVVDNNYNWKDNGNNL